MESDDTSYVGRRPTRSTESAPAAVNLERQRISENLTGTDLHKSTGPETTKIQLIPTLNPKVSTKTTKSQHTSQQQMQTPSVPGSTQKRCQNTHTAAETAGRRNQPITEQKDSRQTRTAAPNIGSEATASKSTAGQSNSKSKMAVNKKDKEQLSVAVEGVRRSGRNRNRPRYLNEYLISKLYNFWLEIVTKNQYSEIHLNN